MHQSSPANIALKGQNVKAQGANHEIKDISNTRALQGRCVLLGLLRAAHSGLAILVALLSQGYASFHYVLLRFVASHF